LLDDKVADAREVASAAAVVTRDAVAEVASVATEACAVETWEAIVLVKDVALALSSALRTASDPTKPGLVQFAILLSATAGMASIWAAMVVVVKVCDPIVTRMSALAATLCAMSPFDSTTPGMTQPSPSGPGVPNAPGTQSQRKRSTLVKSSTQTEAAPMQGWARQGGGSVQTSGVPLHTPVPLARAVQTREASPVATAGAVQASSQILPTSRGVCGAVQSIRMNVNKAKHAMTNLGIPAGHDSSEGGRRDGGADSDTVVVNKDERRSALADTDAVLADVGGGVGVGVVTGSAIGHGIAGEDALAIHECQWSLTVPDADSILAVIDRGVGVVVVAGQSIGLALAGEDALPVNKCQWGFAEANAEAVHAVIHRGVRIGVIAGPGVGPAVALRVLGGAGGQQTENRSNNTENGLTVHGRSKTACPKRQFQPIIGQHASHWLRTDQSILAASPLFTTKRSFQPIVGWLASHWL
jgi:hypothetical protein